MLKNKKIITIGAIAIIAVVIIVIIINSIKNGTDTPNEDDGVIIGVGDNNNNNGGDKVTADNSDDENNTKSDEEETTEATYEVEEGLGKIAGNWVSSDLDAVMQFVPARGNEARIEIFSKGIYYKGTYTTDDKTYIKIDYVNVYNESITGTMTLTVISMEEFTDSFGESIINLKLKDEEGTEYLLKPCYLGTR